MELYFAKCGMEKCNKLYNMTYKNIPFRCVGTALDPKILCIMRII